MGEDFRSTSEVTTSLLETAKSNRFGYLDISENRDRTADSVTIILSPNSTVETVHAGEYLVGITYLFNEDQYLLSEGGGTPRGYNVSSEVDTCATQDAAFELARKRFETNRP